MHSALSNRAPQLDQSSFPAAECRDVCQTMAVRMATCCAPVTRTILVPETTSWTAARHAAMQVEATGHAKSAAEGVVRRVANRGDPASPGPGASRLPGA